MLPAAFKTVPINLAYFVQCTTKAQFHPKHNHTILCTLRSLIYIYCCYIKPITGHTQYSNNIQDACN